MLTRRSTQIRSRARRALLPGAALFLAASFIFTPAGSQEDPAPVAFRTQTMGTWATLTLVTADSASVAGIAYESLMVLHHVDSLMSNWSDASEVARINREAAARRITIHPEVADVLGLAVLVGKQSRGAFDVTIEPLVRLWGFLGGTPRVPSQDEIDAALALVGPDMLDFDADNNTVKFNSEGVKIDFGGIAKGYAVDSVAELLRDAGVSNALVDLSGNMVAIGNAATHDGWAIGIRDPFGEFPLLARIILNDESVATSGDYEQFVGAGGKRYGHILDPRTGWSASGLASVTVVTERATSADAWATALFVLGPARARLIAKDREDLAVVLVEKLESGEVIVWVEEQLRARFGLSNDLGKAVKVRFF